MDREKNISIIMICTRDEQYLEARKWIEKQSVASQIEIIALDNKGNKNYSSAAQALNDGARKASGEYLIFMHQDVYLWEEGVVNKCVNFLADNKDSIVGVAGIRETDNRKCFDIYMSKDKKQYAFKTEGEYVPAITLDECFIAVKKELWEKQPFDEETCDNWHFYGADICYMNTIGCRKNFIMPAEIYHDSYGNPNGKGFKKSAKKIAKKYKGKLKYIYTTCIEAKCSKWGVESFFIKRGIKRFVKKIFKTLGLNSLFDKLNNKRKQRKGEFVE